MSVPAARAELPALSPYQRRLFGFLGVATFFEGYDFFALTQVLPSLRADFGLDHAAAGNLVAFINAGTLLAYLLVGRADRWGRKRVLSVTILGYALFTGLSGLAPNVWVFAALQMIARIFLIGEWATSMVIAAEEFPAERRGMVIGVLGAAAGVGSVVCAGVVPLLTANFGWRSVYFAGVLPLILIAWARRSLRETARFEQTRAEGNRRSVFAILRSPFRRRVLQLGAIWFLTYVCTQNGVAFWKDYAVGELGLSDKEVALVITVGFVISMPLVFLSGKLVDVVGRRRGAVVIYAMLVCGIFGAYSATSLWALTLSMTLAAFGLTAVLTVLNAFTTELFPTELRGDAFAWTNNLIGRIGYVLSPSVIGQIAASTGWGPTLRASVIFPAIALFLILWLLPETRARELEETARTPASGPS